MEEGDASARSSAPETANTRLIDRNRVFERREASAVSPAEVYDPSRSNRKMVMSPRNWTLYHISVLFLKKARYWLRILPIAVN
jgi:hypothetical protein